MKKKYDKKTYLLIVSVAIFLVSSIYLTIQTVATGAEVARLESQQEILLSQKRELENSLVKSTSVNDIEKKSEEMGFIKPSNEDIVYLFGDEAVAKLP